MVVNCRPSPNLTILLVMAMWAAPGCGDEPAQGFDDAGAGVGGEDGTVTGDVLNGDTAGGEDTSGTSDGSVGAVGDALLSDDTSNGADIFGVDTGGTQQDGEAAQGDIADNCPGGAGCGCVDASDCDGGVCIDTAAGKQCAQACVDSCSDGFTCKKTSGADSVFVCFPNYVTLCSPCGAHSDCNAINAGTRCVDYGAMGKFCGGVCKADADCPNAYACVDIADKNTGKTSKQCKLKKVTQGGGGGTCADDGACSQGESCVSGKCAIVVQPLCGCSKWATVFGTSTSCSTSNNVGTCSGVRSCTDKGMSPCSAAVAVEETCNAVDDDCDGVTDKLPAAATCTVASYADEGSKTTCKSDVDCTVAGEGCNAGSCMLFIGACAGEPTCGAKGVLLCKNAKKATAESCNGLDDDCDNSIDEDFGWQEPDTKTTIGVGKSCGQGACAGGKVACENLIKATCTTAAKVAKETCDGVDNDCDGKTDDLACDDGNECTVDSCAGKSGTCANTPGAVCNDKNPCTADSCNVKTGLCEYKFNAGSCDDGDACTVGDACVKSPGVGATCVSGTTLKTCDDSNICTDDSCDKDKGCINLANAATETCFDADQGLIGAGTCAAGVRFCKAGVLVKTCVGQVLPNKIEACDLKDDDCDGSIDEGCDAKAVQIFLSNTSGRTQGGKKGRSVYLHIDGDGPSGTATGKKNSVWSGFVAWMVGAIGA